MSGSIGVTKFAPSTKFIVAVYMVEISIGLLIVVLLIAMEAA